jgi:hypothetical protein
MRKWRGRNFRQHRISVRLVCHLVEPSDPVIIASLTARNYAENFDRSSSQHVGLLLNECLTVMVSRLEMSLKTSLNIGDLQKGHNVELEAAGVTRTKTLNLWSCGANKSMARCLSPTKSFPKSLRVIPPGSSSVVVSSSPVLGVLPGVHEY